MNAITRIVSDTMSAVAELIETATVAAADGHIDRAELPSLLVWADKVRSDLDRLIATAVAQANAGDDAELEATLQRTFARLARAD